ncbi:dephospho-CoA kinase [Tomitella cavernea]|uniref:dephospho-CoA kinase n=1 Tax=Tomitella cavernea TaxID=1387982 RepID=UPI0027DCBB66|nr:dephospho-CoA kinase [Tomitella cavernea]
MGLTGGIGAGKSTVAKVLARAGATVIDADAIAREVVEPGTRGLAELVSEFGGEILTGDGALDRPALASVAFADEASRLRLNAILHPLIGARTQEHIDAAPAGSIVVQDIPLLVEGAMGPLFHLVVVVDADEETRVSRLVGSRGLDEADARARIAAQATEDQRRAAADVWLDNSGPAGALDPAVGRLWEHRLEPFMRNLAAREAARPAPEAAVAANPDGAEGAARRLAQRLRAALGGDAAEVAAHANGAGVAATVRAAGDVTADVMADAMAERMRGAGLVRSGASRFRSADPGAPATVDVVA